MKVRDLKSQAGFTLVEMMIVVAIVGILATIAIPNFKRFQGNARATEAKSQLAALYTAEKSFHAESGGYHTDAFNIGFRPNGALRYVIGFNSPSTYTPPDYMGPALAPNNFSTGVAGVCAIAGCQNLAVTPTGVAITAVSLATTAAMETFNAAAEGFVGGTQNDLWSINDTKVISNDTPGGY